MKEIDGFAINCGKKDRVIYLKDNIYYIGCFEGNYKEAKKAILEKYDGYEASKYINKLDECKIPKTNNELEIFKDSKNWVIRQMTTKYSNKYHFKFKDDESWLVRMAVAKCSDKYHEQLKDDEDLNVRLEVAKYSDKYHYKLKDDKDWKVRQAVALYSDKYHNQFKDDENWEVRRVVSDYRKILKDK